MICLFPTDIKERFTNYILLLIVCLRNMEQFSWNPGNHITLYTDTSVYYITPHSSILTFYLDLRSYIPRSLFSFIPYILLCNNPDLSWMCLFSDHLWVLFPDVVMVITSEVAVDVVKHAFITKFNDISADVSPLCVFSPSTCWINWKVQQLREEAVVPQKKLPTK